MSNLDHEPRTDFNNEHSGVAETNQNSNRKRNRILAGVAGGSALLLAAGVGIGASLGGDSDPQAKPRATHSASPNPGEKSNGGEKTETDQPVTAESLLQQTFSETAVLSSGVEAIDPVTSIDSEFQRDQLAELLATQLDDDLFSNALNADLRNDLIGYYSEDDSLFVNGISLDPNEGEQNIITLQNALSAKSQFLSQANNVANTEEYQTTYEFMTNPENYLTVNDFEQAASTGNATELYKKIYNLEFPTAASAQYQYLKDALALRENDPSIGMDEKDDNFASTRQASRNALDRLTKDYLAKACVGTAGPALEQCAANLDPASGGGVANFVINNYHSPDFVDQIKDTGMETGLEFSAGSTGDEVIAKAAEVNWNYMDMDGDFGGLTSGDGAIYTLTFMAESKFGDRFFERYAIVPSLVKGDQPLFDPILIDTHSAQYNGPYKPHN